MYVNKSLKHTEVSFFNEFNLVGELWTLVHPFASPLDKNGGRTVDLPANFPLGNKRSTLGLSLKKLIAETLVLHNERTFGLRGCPLAEENGGGEESKEEANLHF
jgi:hypothetical protein